MKIIFFIIFFLGGMTIVLQGQNLNADSLKQLLEKTPNDTNKVKIYSEIGYFYQWTNPDSALLYAMPGLALAKKLDFETGEYDLLFPVSEALAMRGSYSSALKFRFRSIELANRLKDPTKIANSLALAGAIYKYSKEYSKALEYYYKAKETNAVTLGGPQILNGFIGQAYFHLHKWDSALVYIQKAYDLDVRDTNGHWSVPYTYLAAIYEQKGNLVKAIDLYKESLAISVVNSDKLDNYNGIASVFNKTGQADSAIFYAKQVVSQGTTVSMLAPVIQASTLLVGIYKSKYNTDSAFKYQEILLSTKDSLFSQDKVKQMQSVTFDEQLRQQELGIEKEKYKNKIKLYVMVAALAVFITIGIILWRTNKTKQKANALLKSKNKEVETTLSELKSTQAQLIQSEKMASLGKLQQAVLDERLRISHELHDEVGSTLSGIAMYSHLTKEQIKQADTIEVEKSLDVMQQSAGEMVTKLNDIVWLINPDQDSPQKLIQRLEEYARDMAVIKNMQVKINVPEHLAENSLPVESRRNMYLFCKEAINNAVKYSEGTLLELNIKEIDNNLEFSVRDNGKGFDAVMVRRGNGLDNMQKRADEIGAKLILQSKKDEGSLVSMQLKSS